MGIPCAQVENILKNSYVKIPAEFFDHCQNFYKTFEVPAGCKRNPRSDIGKAGIIW